MSSDPGPIPVEVLHLVLFCRAWDACVGFYRDTMGFPEVDAREGFLEVEAAPAARIGLIRVPRSSRREAGAGPFLVSLRVTDIDRTHRLLSERLPGLEPVRAHPWGADLFEIRDPEGRRLEFWSPRKGWPEGGPAG